MENAEERKKMKKIEKEEQLKKKRKQFYEIADSYLFGLHIA